MRDLERRVGSDRVVREKQQQVRPHGEDPGPVRVLGGSERRQCALGLLRAQRGAREQHVHRDDRAEPARLGQQFHGTVRRAGVQERLRSRPQEQGAMVRRQLAAIELALEQLDRARREARGA